MAAFFQQNGDAGQGEAARVPVADSTLVTIPGSGHSDAKRIDAGRGTVAERGPERRREDAAMNERRAIRSLVRVASL